LITAALLVGACGAAPSPPRPASVADEADLVVVAPHPDDETILAGGVIAAARARGARVAVIVVTNGDFTCERDGHARQRETLAALERLAVSEDDVHFLGYPDGFLAALGDDPLPPTDRRTADGRCVKASGTYAEHGAARRDEHAARTGSHAPYDARSLEEDLASLLARLRPRDVYVTHPLDEHPDHAATYAYVRRALDGAPGPPPRVHLGIVHAGPCWPDGRGRTEPCPVIQESDRRSRTPALPDPYGAYAPSERVPVVDPVHKLAAIEAYRSQLGADPAHDWLTSFARADEPFWPEPSARGASTRVTLSAEAPSGAIGAYRAELARTGDALTLYRDERLIRRWPLPLSRRDRPHRFDVTIAPALDQHVICLTVARDGALLGVAFDPDVPEPRGGAALRGDGRRGRPPTAS